MIITSNLTSAALQATFCRKNCPEVYNRLPTSDLGEDCLSAIIKRYKNIDEI